MLVMLVCAFCMLYVLIFVFHFLTSCPLRLLQNLHFFPRGCCRFPLCNKKGTLVPCFFFVCFVFPFSGKINAKHSFGCIVFTHLMKCHGWLILNFKCSLCRPHVGVMVKGLTALQDVLLGVCTFITTCLNAFFFF